MPPAIGFTLYALAREISGPGWGRMQILWGIPIWELNIYKRSAMFFAGMPAPRRGYYRAEQERIAKIAEHVRRLNSGG